MDNVKIPQGCSKIFTYTAILDEVDCTLLISDKLPNILNIGD